MDCGVLSVLKQAKVLVLAAARQDLLFQVVDLVALARQLLELLHFLAVLLRQLVEEWVARAFEV